MPRSFHPISVSLLFFFVVASIGTLLRSGWVGDLPLEYKHLVHAHSHVAFQGWVYTALFLILTKLFISEEQFQEGKYRLQFWLTVIIVLGVLISFSLQGYALYSIIFSTLFQLLNYWFIFRFFKDTKHLNRSGGYPTSIRFIRAGLWFGVLSTLVPFVIGFLAAKGLAGSEIYNSFVYTFLHLQYNCWFLFVAIGIFYQFLERDQIRYNDSSTKWFYWIFLLAALPSITLSLLGMSFSEWTMPLAWLSSAMLVLGAFFFIRSMGNSLMELLKKESFWSQLFFLSFILLFLLKLLLQALSVIPSLQAYAFGNKLIILAYLHLSLIGVISFLLIGAALKLGWIQTNTLSKLGGLLLFVGFITTEAILGLGGLGVFYSRQMLVLGSIAMVAGIFVLLLSVQK